MVVPFSRRSTGTQRLRIGMDMDGVLSNFTKAFSILLGMDPEIDEDESPVWDWPQFYGFGDDEIYQAWKRVQASPIFWYGLDTLDREAMKEIDRTQFAVDYHFITARTGATAQEQTEKWLRQRGIEHPNVFVTDRKWEISVDVMVDDRPINLMNMAQHHKNMRLFLVHRNHNANVAFPETCKVERTRSALTALRRLGSEGWERKKP